MKLYKWYTQVICTNQKKIWVSIYKIMDTYSCYVVNVMIGTLEKLLTQVKCFY